MMATSGGSALKRRDIGLAGAIITLAQVLSSLHSSRNLSFEIDQLKAEFHLSKREQEKYFVKKEELKKVVTKLGRIDEKLAKISQQMNSMNTVWNQVDDDGTVGCTYTKFLTKSSGGKI